MPHKWTERKWFFAAIVFLLFYCGFLVVFRSILNGVEEKNSISIFKPEPAQITGMGLLILLYHFFFLGLYTFSIGGRWQKSTAFVVALLVISSVLFIFLNWYHAVAHPYLRITDTTKLPWYAQERAKFLMANIPLLVFFVLVFILRLLMIYKPPAASCK